VTIFESPGQFQFSAADYRVAESSAGFAVTATVGIGIVIATGRTVTALVMAARLRVMWNLDDTSIARPIR